MHIWFVGCFADFEYTRFEMRKSTKIEGKIKNLNAPILSH